MGRPLVAWVIALVVGVAACGGGGGAKKDKTGQYGSDLLTGTTNTVAPRATLPPTTSAAQAASAKSKPAPVTTPARSPTTGKPTGDPVSDAAHGGTGEFAGMLLSSKSPVKTIVYEVMAQSGLAPRQHTLDHTVGNLRKYSGKTVRIENTELPGGPSQWNAAQLHTYADKFTRFKSGGDTAVLHVLFVHGSLPGAAGVATRADVLSMFPDSYKGGAPTVSEAAIEDVVVTHETGHILGLVDLWLNTGRGDYSDDPAPGGHHSPNKRSVMYWRVETLDVLSFFEGGPPTEYDPADQRDLNSIHNGAEKGAKS